MYTFQPQIGWLDDHIMSSLEKICLVALKIGKIGGKKLHTFIAEIQKGWGTRVEEVGDDDVDAQGPDLAAAFEQAHVPLHHRHCCGDAVHGRHMQWNHKFEFSFSSHKQADAMES